MHIQFMAPCKAIASIHWDEKSKKVMHSYFADPKVHAAFISWLRAEDIEKLAAPNYCNANNVLVPSIGEWIKMPTLKEMSDLAEEGESV